MLKNRRYKKASSRIAKRHKVRKLISRVFKITLTVAFLAGIIFVLRADFLQIKNFEVSGAETISAESLKSTAQSLTLGNKLFLIPKSNIILLSKNNLASILLSNFSRLEKVEVNKQFFGQKVELKVTERKDDFLWCSQEEECFFMTKDGFIFESAFPGNPRGKIIFRGILEREPLMKSFATPAKMRNYSNFIEILKSGGFEVNSVNIESTDKAVAETNIGGTTIDVIFNPEETDLSPVAQNIILLINEIKNKTSSTRFEYIDARFGNKIFYKLI